MTVYIVTMANHAGDKTKLLSLWCESLFAVVVGVGVATEDVFISI